MGMRFDWREFCDFNGIEYKAEGQKNVYIHCPFCGEEDAGKHMGLSVNVHNPAWGCWRNSEHRGRNPVKLVQRLLSCDLRVAQNIVDAARGYDDPAEEKREERPKRIEIPKTCRRFSQEKKQYQDEFLWYLKHRGFNKPLRFAQQYDLRYSLVAPWERRIVIPVYDRRGTLVALTGRYIGKDTAQPRYFTEGSIKNCLFNELKAHNSQYHDLLAVTEGPFDALKLNWSFEEHALYGSHAVAFCGKAWTEDQFASLVLLAKKYKRVEILLDADAETDSMRLAAQLISYGIYGGLSKIEAKDPGEMTERQIKDLFEVWQL